MLGFRDGLPRLEVDFTREGQHLAAGRQHLAGCWQHSARSRQQAPAGTPQETASLSRTQQAQASSPWRAPARGASFAEQGRGCCSSISSVFFHNTHALQLLPNSCFSGINMHAEMNSSIGLGLNILNQRVLFFFSKS
jgi:hypothetical protein